MSIDKSATTYVAGHRGLVGSAIWRRLEAEGYTNLVGRTSAELDLRDREATFDFLREVRPRYVILAAARVGGILANDTYPADVPLRQPARSSSTSWTRAQEVDVERLVFLGSSCIYPKFAPQPIKEEYLMTGPLEPTNDAYAIAKIAGILQVQSARKQYGRRWISAMPTNLYGPGDNFSPTTSHVLPALIRRYVEAKEAGLERVTNWGSGTPQREFLHVDDLARAIVLLLEEYDAPEPINVGTGEDQSDPGDRRARREGGRLRGRDRMGHVQAGRDAAQAARRLAPEGARLELRRSSLEDGLRETVSWFHEHRAEIRA